MAIPISEIRKLPLCTMRIHTVENSTNPTMISATIKPGWKWSEHVKPFVHTESCTVDHVGICLKGTMHIKYDDGTEIDLKEGDRYYVPAGHDGWVVGDETVSMIEFTGAPTMAKNWKDEAKTDGKKVEE